MIIGVSNAYLNKTSKRFKGQMSCNGGMLELLTTYRLLFGWDYNPKRLKTTGLTLINVLCFIRNIFLWSLKPKAEDEYEQACEKYFLVYFKTSRVNNWYLPRGSPEVQSGHDLCFNAVKVWKV